MNLFENYELPKERKAPTYYFQEVALQALEYLEVPNNKRSEIFKWAKKKPEKLAAALNYMKDKNKRHFLYLAKIMNT